MNAPDRRRAELAKIHILAKQLGLDDQAYRAVLWAVARVDSARDLDSHGRAAVLEQLQSRMPGARPAVRSSPDRAPLIRKIHQLLGERPVEYAMGILTHMYGRMTPERLEWASVLQLRKVIAALVYDQRRHPASASTKPEVPA